MTNTLKGGEKSYWVVVANESQATIYGRKTRTGPFIQLDSLENEAGRKKAGELLSDRGGRSFDSFGAGRHTMTPERDDPKTHLAKAFAKQIAERVGRVMHDGSCRGYALVAAPRFLGYLRDSLSRESKLEPFKTVAKDVVGEDTKVLQELVDSD